MLCLEDEEPTSDFSLKSRDGIFLKFMIFFVSFQIFISSEGFIPFLFTRDCLKRETVRSRVPKSMINSTVKLTKNSRQEKTL